MVRDRLSLYDLYRERKLSDVPVSSIFLLYQTRLFKWVYECQIKLKDIVMSYVIGVVVFVIVIVVLVIFFVTGDEKKKELGSECMSNGRMRSNRVVTNCFHVSVTETQADEFFGNNYANINLEPKTKQKDDMNAIEYELVFKYDPLDLIGVTRVMFSDNASRPNSMINDGTKGQITMTKQKRGNPSIVMMMSPYIPSLRLTKITSKRIGEPDWQENSLGTYSLETHAYIHTI
jgi:hypothetical protein